MILNTSLPNRYIELWEDFYKFKEYKISSYGRVYSTKSDKFLRPYQHKSRSGIYMRFNINGKKEFAHRLVAEHFLGDIAGLQVDHIDGNTLNNNINNLEIVAERENKLRIARMKRRPV